MLTGVPLELSYGHLARCLTLRRVQDMPHPQYYLPLALTYLPLDRNTCHCLPRGPSSLPLLTTATQAILQTRVGSRPRFVGPGQRLLTLCTLSLVVMHWYACGMWLIGERQAAAGRGTWVSQVYV